MRGDFMDYITVSLVTSAVTICIVHKLAKMIFDVHIKFKQLLFCAGCAVFINLMLPKIFISYGKIVCAVLIALVCSAICSYYISYYDQSHTEKNEKN